MVNPEKVNAQAAIAAIIKSCPFKNLLEVGYTKELNYERDGGNTVQRKHHLISHRLYVTPDGVMEGKDVPVGTQKVWRRRPGELEDGSFRSKKNSKVCSRICGKPILEGINYAYKIGTAPWNYQLGENIDVELFASDPQQTEGKELMVIVRV